MGNSIKKSKKNQPIFRNSKEEKLFYNLLRITEQFISGKSFKSLTQEELMKRLALPEQHKEIFSSVLKQLISQNLVSLIDGHYSWKHPAEDVITGVIKIHARGFGFVQTDPSSNYSQDIFIPKHLTKNAVDGDSVEVLINHDSVTDKGPEGKVIAILSRARTHMAGIIRNIDRQDLAIAYVPLLGTQQKVIVESDAEHPLKAGDRIVMKVKEWGTKETETICQFSHHLGHISDPSCDISSAIEAFQLRSDFPKRAIEEAHTFGKQVSRTDIQNREDLRHLTTLTIDPDTAKDFDDALNLTKDEEGIYHLGVHIADVSHYVQLGSALDKEARARCNSTYFPNFCLPMLPGDLSENLCSLKPNVNRLTVSVLMRLDPTGTLIDYRITRSVIKSAKRFTYKEAKLVLDGVKSSPHSLTLHLMVELCGLLKKKRYERGSIEFALPELVVLVDEKGMPYKTDYITYDVTHQMVEEFMLKANELIAWDLTQKGKNVTYRVHDEPTEDNLRDFSFLANAFGFSLPDFPTVQDLQKLFDDAQETTYVNYLASSYIRRMRLAQYSPENIGHYGLSLTHYCHFTSPIRRYVDLVVHRILFGEYDDFEYLREISQECSEQERISAKAESNVVLLKKLRLLDKMQNEDQYREYEAIITRVKNFGIYFEIIDLLLEGFIHISELDADYYLFEEELMRLRGSSHGGLFTAGDRLTVQLQEIDFILQETKWYLVANQHSDLSPKTSKSRKKGSSRSRPDKSSSKRKTNNRKIKSKTTSTPAKTTISRLKKRKK